MSGVLSMIRSRAIPGLLLLCGSALPLAAQGALETQRLGWLGGCWQLRSGTRLVEEQWMAPRGGMMLGVSRTTRADSVVEFEQLRIYQRDGKAIYAAQPSRQAPAEFTAVTMNDTLVVFENLAHDFPQRIQYRRRGADSLIARIEGPRGGQMRGIDFPYARSACP